MEKIFKKYGITKKMGEIIFCEYEPGYTIFFLINGIVKLSKITKEAEKTLAILKTGAVFGEMSIFSNNHRTATCIAESDIELLELNKDDFKALIYSKPNLGIQLLNTIIKRILDQNKKLKLMNQQKNDSIVLDTLLMLGDVNESNISPNILYVNKKPSEIANWTGMDLKTNEKTLALLESKGLIKTSIQGITIKDVSKAHQYLKNTY